MKKYILSLCAALLLPLPVLAGDVAPGSVPGTLNYQGRLERDNAPVTGPVHIYFRIYNSPTAANASGGNCGDIAQPCLWESPEITAQATQGIFSADLTPPAAVLSGGERLYLEVQVESDTLSPREPLNSVAYAVVAKRLENGASVAMSSLTVYHQVYLATTTAASVGVGGTIRPSTKLTVDGDIELINGGRLKYPDGSIQPSALVGGVAGGITSTSDATILADSDSSGSDNILFGIRSFVGTNEKARITAAGDFGVGTNAPMGKLDVDGALFVGGEGISDRDDNEVNITQDLVVDGGRVRGIGNNYLALGETLNTIIAATNNTERLRIDASGNLGVGGTAPASERVYSSANIRAAAGVRGANVSIGAYSNTWTGLLNEVRAADASHLLLQQTNPFNVGIGTDTPREKLHVRGSVLSDYGVIAATAAFSGDVRIDGNLDANSNGNIVHLSSTIVYGYLQVTGGIGSMAGIPAYIASSNTFTGQNTFVNQMTVSSDVIVNSRLGVGAIGFDFPGDDYLQVGGNTSEFAHNAAAYLVAGSTGEARVAFYRGPVKAASLETLSGNYLPNLALVVGGQAKTITDSVYHRIQNSVVWISTGHNTTPSIFVSSTIGNVGMGTSVMDPNWRLTVAGNLRIDGSGNGIIFPDGTSIVSAQAIGSANSISANADAVITSNADLVGGGNVILRAGSLDGLVLNTGGNVGIGTLNPVSRLNVRGGDLVLGTPINPYSADSVEDLVVAGNIAFDGELLQRSNSQVRLSGLMVASDVYLSTGATGRTGIGTITPQTKLEVNGDAQFGSGPTKSTFTSTGALQLATDLAVQYGGTGAGSFLLNGVLYGNGTSALQDTTAGAQYQVLRAGAGGVPAFGSINLDQAAAVAGTLPVGNGGTGAATLTGVLRGNGTGAFTVMTGTAARVTRWSDSNTIDASAILTDNGTRFGVAAPIDAAGAITTASSGTFRAEGGAQYSLLTSSGIKVNSGSVDVTGYVNVSGRVVTSAFRMDTGVPANYILATDADGNASWVNPASGSFGDGWIGNEVTGVADTTLSRSGSGSVGDPYELAINLGNANTWTAAQAFSAGLSGNLTGNVTGNVSGTAASVTGAAQTAITSVGTLTGLTMGGTLAMGANNITMTGTLGTTGSRLTKGWFTDLQVTNPINGSITGNAATVTTNANLTGNVTSVGNATTIASLPAISGANLTNLTAANISAGTAGINISGNAANVTGTVAVANGGTGRTALTAGQVLVGNGTSAVTLVNGVTANYTVVVDTFPYTCSEFQFTNGILIAVGAGTCP